MKNILKKILIRLCLPVRLVVQAELQKSKADLLTELDQRDSVTCQNIELRRHLRSLDTTAEYVDRRMTEATSFPSKFELLTFALTQIKKGEGLFCEFGVFTGSTINHIAGSTQSLVHGFDSFEGLPEGWYGLKKGHFAVDNLPKVLPNVRLIKGWFNETLPKFVAEHPETITFLHVDCDLCSSTKMVFEALAHKIVPGTVIVFDEYFNYPNWEQGEFRAFQEFIKSSSLGYDYIGYNRYGQQSAVIIRQKN